MTQPKTQPQDFAAFLAAFSHGAVNEAATEKLRELVEACVENGDKGSLTIKITVDAQGKLAELDASLKLSKPEPRLPGEVFFTAEGGELSREDPRQMRIPSKILDAPASLKTINGGNQ